MKLNKMDITQIPPSGYNQPASLLDYTNGLKKLLEDSPPGLLSVDDFTEMVAVVGG